MSMDKILPLASGIPPIADPSSLQATGGESGTTSAFHGALKEAISSINDIQVEAGHAVNALATGQSQNIHQAMIALQQADVSFQLMMQIRNKLVTAYEEIQRMQI